MYLNNKKDNCLIPNSEYNYISKVSILLLVRNGVAKKILVRNAFKLHEFHDINNQLILLKTETECDFKLFSSCMALSNSRSLLSVTSDDQSVFQSKFRRPGPKVITSLSSLIALQIEVSYAVIPYDVPNTSPPLPTHKKMI